MTIKIKEFKGSLNPIFNTKAKTDVGSEGDGLLHEEVIQKELFLNRIKPNADQPRKIFNEALLHELAASIKAQGMIQPIVVRPIADGYYEIIIGERRWRAAKLAGLEKIPVIIRDYHKADRLSVALIENIQRENLNPLEEAETLKKLIEECAMTQTEVAESIGRSRVTVTNLLRLLDLPMEIKAMIHESLLEMGHARALLSLPYEHQVEAAHLVVTGSLSVRETERLVQKLNTDHQARIVSITIDPNFEKKMAAWKIFLAEQLSSKVNIHFNSDGKGRIVIHFSSTEEADWLMDHITVVEEELA